MRNFATRAVRVMENLGFLERLDRVNYDFELALDDGNWYSRIAQEAVRNGPKKTYVHHCIFLLDPSVKESSALPCTGTASPAEKFNLYVTATSTLL